MLQKPCFETCAVEVVLWKVHVFTSYSLHISQAQSQAQPPLLSPQSFDSSSESDESEVEFSAFSLESQWALLITTIVEILSNHKKALKKMKSALEYRVISSQSENPMKR